MCWLDLRRYQLCQSLTIVRLTFPGFGLSLIGIGGLREWSTSATEPIEATGEASSLLFLLCGVTRFLTLGVWGEFETFPLIFEPLAVFFSIHITLS